MVFLIRPLTILVLIFSLSLLAEHSEKQKPPQSPRIQLKAGPPQDDFSTKEQRQRRLEKAKAKAQAINFLTKGGVFGKLRYGQDIEKIPRKYFYQIAHLEVVNDPNGGVALYYHRKKDSLVRLVPGKIECLDKECSQVAIRVTMDYQTKEWGTLRNRSVSFWIVASVGKLGHRLWMSKTLSPTLKKLERELDDTDINRHVSGTMSVVATPFKNFVSIDYESREEKGKRKGKIRASVDPWWTETVHYVPNEVIETNQFIDLSPKKNNSIGGVTLVPRVPKDPKGRYRYELQMDTKGTDFDFILIPDSRTKFRIKPTQK